MEIDTSSPTSISSSSSPASPPSPELDLENLKALKTLGKGAMGTVFLVYDRAADPSASHPFALKVVDLSAATKPDASRRAFWEISVLSRLRHPFLPALLGSSRAAGDCLAWALPYCPGGDLNVLRYHQNDRVFSQAVARFYLAEIVCALEHLHSMGIAYRDLKPENVLIQTSGHVTLTDFDLCRSLKRRADDVAAEADNTPVMVRRKLRRNLTRWIVADRNGSSNKNNNKLRKAKSARVSPVSRRKPSFTNGERSNSFVGTEEYVSPEVVRGEGHEFAVDWWALGVLTYEMVYGATPFKGKNRKETFRNVLVKEPEFPGKPNALTDLIRRLLEKDPTRRLGYARGACEIKDHEFFRGLGWDLLTEVMRPPFIPARDDDGESPVPENGGFDVREYLAKLRSPSSVPPSPDCRRLSDF